MRKFPCETKDDEVKIFFVRTAPVSRMKIANNKRKHTKSVLFFPFFLNAGRWQMKRMGTDEKSHGEYVRINIWRGDDSPNLATPHIWMCNCVCE